MSEIGVAGLDHTIQETNVWLKLVGHKMHRDDKHKAYVALRAVLHVLRDRLTPEEAVHFGAQLPTLIRGFYFEGWHMAGSRESPLTDEFAERVTHELPPGFEIDGLTVTRMVLDAVCERIDPREATKIAGHLPPQLRTIWPDTVR
jgi:uncharacterized protein (DUF2267 family)